MREHEFLPEYEYSRTTDKIVKTLTDAGYTRLGYGADKTVWGKDSDRVIGIIMPGNWRLRLATRCFIALYKLAQSQPNNPYLPRYVTFRDERGNENHYRQFNIDDRPFLQFGMERLEHGRDVDLRESIESLGRSARSGTSFDDAIKNPNVTYRPWFPQFYQTLIAVVTQARKYRVNVDLLTGDNVLYRADGTPVIVDPYYPKVGR